jgi:hypothetical protein
LVDGYRVDIYPSRDMHRFASTRTDDFEQDAFALCTAAKPWQMPTLVSAVARPTRSTERRFGRTARRMLLAYPFRGDVILLLDMLVFKNYFCGALCLEPLTFGEVMC